MKRRITLAYALSLSLLVSLAGFASTAQAQQGLKPVAHTGILWRHDSGTQALRITVLGTGGNDAIRVRFGWQLYGGQTCNTEGVCRHSIVSQGRTAPVMLNDGEALSFDAPGTGGGVRLVVFSNNPKIRVTGQFINNFGEATGFFDVYYNDLD